MRQARGYAAPAMSGLLAYSKRYRLGFKVLPVTNVLAYFGGA